MEEDGKKPSALQKGAQSSKNLARLAHVSVKGDRAMKKRNKSFRKLNRVGSMRSLKGGMFAGRSGSVRRIGSVQSKMVTRLNLLENVDRKKSQRNLRGDEEDGDDHESFWGEESHADETMVGDQEIEHDDLYLKEAMHHLDQLCDLVELHDGITLAFAIAHAFNHRESVVYPHGQGPDANPQPEFSDNASAQLASDAKSVKEVPMEKHDKAINKAVSNLAYTCWIGGPLVLTLVHDSGLAQLLTKVIRVKRVEVAEIIMQAVGTFVLNCKFNQDLFGRLGWAALLAEYTADTYSAVTRMWATNAMFGLLCNHGDNQTRALRSPMLPHSLRRIRMLDWSKWAQNDAAELCVMLEVDTFDESSMSSKAPTSGARTSTHTPAHSSAHSPASEHTDNSDDELERYLDEGDHRAIKE